jgi:hypothetical protein
VLLGCLWLSLSAGCGDDDAAAPLDAGGRGRTDAGGPSSRDGSDHEDVADGDQALPDAATWGGEPRARGSLVDHKLWSRVKPAADPFSDGPAQVDCEFSATNYEYLGDEWAFSVDTGSCNYVTVQQPALRDIASGETIKLRLWHFELSAPEPAEAHAAVMVDGILVLDERIPIPAPGGLVVRELRIERAVEAGAPVLFHLHNHGANSWSLVEVSNGSD